MKKIRHIRKDLCFYVWSALACVGITIISMVPDPSENHAGIARIIAVPVIYMIGFFVGEQYFKRTKHIVTTE